MVKVKPIRKEVFIISVEAKIITRNTKIEISKLGAINSAIRADITVCRQSLAALNEQYPGERKRDISEQDPDYISQKSALLDLLKTLTKPYRENRSEIRHLSRGY